MIEINTMLIERVSDMTVEIPHFNLMVASVGIMTLMVMAYYDSKAMRSYSE
jgi:hypothetical protein